MRSGDHKPGFRIGLDIKDLMNAQDTGHQGGAPLPLSAHVLQMLRQGGFGQPDHSALR